VFVTAFYSFRMYFLVFHGKERYDQNPDAHHGHDDHGHDHGPHESPWVVTVPLILLAIPSVLIGFYTIDPLVFGEFFKDAIVINSDNPAPYNNIDNPLANLNQLQAAVASDWQACEAQAVRIGQKSGHAKNLKEKLKCSSMDAPLFDTQRLMRHIEIAYAQMHQRVQQGLEPQAFEVEAEYGA
jgi:NADH:ubiquinone oxidoreductase subunit 5 (subunit L)/multisubunit Na+/H+ antiporter MnhA subunit